MAHILANNGGKMAQIRWKNGGNYLKLLFLSEFVWTAFWIFSPLFTWDVMPELLFHIFGFGMSLDVCWFSCCLCGLGISWDVRPQFDTFAVLIVPSALFRKLENDWVLARPSVPAAELWRMFRASSWSLLRCLFYSQSQNTARYFCTLQAQTARPKRSEFAFCPARWFLRLRRLVPRARKRRRDLSDSSPFAACRGTSSTCKCPDETVVLCACDTCSSCRPFRTTNVLI